ncbi:hypothetical protein [Nocardia sp. NPDC057455]|uniref:hypothetical protein n=1 Tax=Nocardia sp. NPDC057455 TaxID=3346138 RepID=UPI0036728466
MSMREPLIPDRGEPPRTEKQYRITYRDEYGAEFVVLTDEISYLAIRRQLVTAGYDVAMQRRRVDISAWEMVA